MPDDSRLKQMIRSHWLNYRPQMVEELHRTNRLEEALKEAEERTTGLMYEFICVHKMQYQEAWEQATAEWRLPETETRPHETSS